MTHEYDCPGRNTDRMAPESYTPKPPRDDDPYKRLLFETDRLDELVQELIDEVRGASTASMRYERLAAVEGCIARVRLLLAEHHR